MKNIKNALLTVICLLLGVNIVSAQANQQTQNINCVVIDGHPKKITDLQSENINSGNAINYNASFNISISQNSEFTEVLKAFLEFDKKSASGNILINKYVGVAVDNNVAKINEQWTYISVIIDEVILPGLDASTTRQTAYVKIKFHTTKAKVSYNVGNDISLKTIVVKEVASLNSNYRFNLEDLPCNYISKISTINLCKTAVKNITLTIAARDIAAWNEVMTNNPTKLFKRGRLTYLHPNFRDELFIVNFLNMKITSIRNLPTSGSQIQKYEIVLSFESESIGKK